MPRALGRRMDELEERIAELREQEELDAIRPPLDGRQVMAYLGVPPGRVIGDALDFLLEARLDDGPIDEPDAYVRLDDVGARPRHRARGHDRRELTALFAGPPHDRGRQLLADLPRLRAPTACGAGLEDGVDAESGAPELGEQLAHVPGVELPGAAVGAADGDRPGSK